MQIHRRLIKLNHSIILHNAGAQRATLLSRNLQQAVCAYPVVATDNDTNNIISTGVGTASGSSAGNNIDELNEHPDMDWRIDAMIEFDQPSMYLHPKYATQELSPVTSPNGTTSTATASNVDHCESSFPSSACPLSSSYPRSILNFVLHSQKSVILADAVNDKVFGSDPCIRTHRPRSILCLPLILRNSLISVLYLEHPSIPAAFTRDRLLCCKLITQQAAISMETALLYSTMEAQVQQRTAQLNAATQQALEANQVKSCKWAHRDTREHTCMQNVFHRRH